MTRATPMRALLAVAAVTPLMLLPPAHHPAAATGCTSGTSVAGLCTHGVDTAPPAQRCYSQTGLFSLLNPAYANPLLCTYIHEPAPPARKAVACGTDDYRVQAIYLRAGTHPDYYRGSVNQITQYLMAGDDLLNASARQQGGSRHLRLVTDGSCTINVRNVVTNGPVATFADVVHALQAAGYQPGPRVWVAFVDANGCGYASLPDPAQVNSYAAGRYAAVWTGCWTGRWVLHEISHTIGAVQNDAPHSTGAAHCTDGLDVMCYADGGPHSTQASPNPCPSLVYDCRHDDYFGLAPQGPWLPTHLNLRDSRFLGGAS